MAKTSANFFQYMCLCDPGSLLGFEVTHTKGLSGDKTNDLQSLGLLQDMYLVFIFILPKGL